MTDKEIKRMISNAYMLPETDKGRSFVRNHEKRSLRIMDILKVEFRYMGIPSVFSSLFLWVLFLIVSRTRDMDVIWIVSALIPLCAIVPMILLSGSERYGMDELEASSRFSLRYVRLVRMLIIGLFTIGVFGGIGIIMKTISFISCIDYMIFVVIPYLLSDFGAMLVARKWYGKENIFGIIAVCVLGSLIPYGIRMIRNAGRLPDVILVSLTVFLLVAVIGECVLYVKESENISWNLC